MQNTHLVLALVLILQGQTKREVSVQSDGRPFSRAYFIKFSPSVFPVFRGENFGLYTLTFLLVGVYTDYHVSVMWM